MKAGSNYIQFSTPCSADSPLAILVYNASSNQLFAEESGNCMHDTYSFTYNASSFKENGILNYKIVIIDRKQEHEYLVNFTG